MLSLMPSCVFRLGKESMKVMQGVGGLLLGLAHFLVKVQVILANF